MTPADAAGRAGEDSTLWDHDRPELAAKCALVLRSEDLGPDGEEQEAAAAIGEAAATILGFVSREAARDRS